nr:MAG: capsid protein [Cressdnaviricota sp.]
MFNFRYKMQGKYNPLRDYITPENVIRALNGARSAYNTYQEAKRYISDKSSSSSTARTTRRPYSMPRRGGIASSIRRYGSNRRKLYSRPRRNYGRYKPRFRASRAGVSSGVSNPYARFNRGKKFRGGKGRFCRAVKACVLKDIVAQNVVIRDEPFAISGLKSSNTQNLEQYFAIACGLSTNDLKQVQCYLTNSTTLPTMAGTSQNNTKGYITDGFAHYEMLNNDVGAMEVTKYVCYPRTDVPLEYVAPGSVATAFPGIFGPNPQLFINGILTKQFLPSGPLSSTSLVNAVSGAGSGGGGVQWGLSPFHSQDWCRLFKVKKAKTIVLTPGSCTKWRIKLRGPKQVYNAKFDGVANVGNAQVFIHQRKQGPVYLFRVRPCVGGLGLASAESTSSTFMSGMYINCMKHLQYKIAYVLDNQPSLTLDSTTAVNLSNTNYPIQWQQPVGGLQGQ